MSDQPPTRPPADRRPPTPRQGQRPPRQPAASQPPARQSPPRQSPRRPAGPARQSPSRRSLDLDHLDEVEEGAPLSDEQMAPVRPSRGALIAASIVTVLAVAFLVVQGGGGGGGGGSDTPTYDEEVYFTREGDTFDSIGQVLVVDPEALASENDMSTSDSLEVGTKLDVPDDPSTDVTAPPVSESPDPSGVEAEIEQWAERYGVPAALMKGLAWQESSWDQSETSDAGAVGVTQLLPDTASYVADDLLMEPTLSLDDQSDNIQMGTRYLAYLLELNSGDWGAALASYNEGPTSVRRNGWSTEATQYVTDVMTFTRGFQAEEQSG